MPKPKAILDTVKRIYKTTYGNNKGGEITVLEGKQLLDSVVKITDQFGKEYKVEKFRFMYRQLGGKEDLRNGKIIPVYDMLSNVFDDNRLSELWRNSLKALLKAKEEWRIDMIFFKDKDGKYQLAPELSFKIN